MHKLTIVIPCLNEAETIQRVVVDIHQAIRKSRLKNTEIIIADGNSTDGTLKILKKYRKVKVLTVPVKGYGAAIHYGILKAKGDYVLYADADLSYPFSELHKFTPYMEKGADLVLGSRITGTIDKGAMPPLHRYLGTPVLTFLIKILYGINTSDSNSGMRLIKKSFYKKLHMRNSGMEWSSELLIKTAMNNGIYAEVPIRLKKDARTHHPHLNTWVDGWKNLKAIILPRPENLLVPTGLFLFVSGFFWNTSFPKFLYFFSLAALFWLSFLAAKILNYSINSRLTPLVNLVLHFPIVISAAILTIISFILLFVKIVPPEIILLTISLSAIINMWMFFIEAVKTHLINILPEDI